MKRLALFDWANLPINIQNDAMNVLWHHAIGFWMSISMGQTIATDVKKFDDTPSRIGKYFWLHDLIMLELLLL